MPDVDPYALDLPEEEITLIDENIEREQSSATWEHENLAQVRIKVLRGHTNVVRSCQFTGNDTKILTASNDNKIMMWDFASGANLQVYEGHSMYVTKARANADATKFISSSWDKHVHMWDAETADITWSGKHIGIVTCCNISHDGKMAVSGSDLDHSVKVWDVATGEIIAETKDLHSSTISSVSFNPGDDRIITTSMDMSTRFWDLKSLKATLTLRGHMNIISEASCSQDERKLATVSWDKSIQIWDVSTGMYRSAGTDSIEKAHEGNISSCYFGQDGSILVSGGYDNTVAVWDVDNMVQKLRLQGHSDWVEDVCATKDGNWLLSCGKDKTVRLWNIEESDRIPLVLENKKSIGLKIFKVAWQCTRFIALVNMSFRITGCRCSIQCSSCGKPFSMAQMENPKDDILCLFCRLQTPDRNIPVIEDTIFDD